MIDVGVGVAALLLGLLVVALYVRGTLNSILTRHPRKPRHDVIPIREHGGDTGDEDSGTETEMFAQAKQRTSPRCEDEDEPSFSFTCTAIQHGEGSEVNHRAVNDRPGSPEGEEKTQRKKFDRSSLLRARTSSLKQDKPESLIRVLDEYRINADLRNLMTRKSSNASSGGRRSRGSSRSRNNSVNSMPRPTGPIIPLAKTKDRWMPADKAALSIDAKVHKEVQGILNKLCPERFDKLSDRLAQIDYTQPMVMRVVVDLMFETALSNPFFSASYADLAVLLAARWPPFTLEGDICDFKTELLTRCQRHFDERGENDESIEDLDSGAKDIVIAKGRTRSINNVHFLGRLYCSHMLTEEIMHQSIHELLESALKDQDDQEIEAICKLLTTVGKELDKGANKKIVSQYMDSLRELSERKDLVPRFKFMLMDLVDLRKNKWKPRRSTASPKKLHDIRNEHNGNFRPPSLRLGPSSSYAASRANSKTKRSQSQALPPRDFFTTPPHRPSAPPPFSLSPPIAGSSAQRSNEHASGTFTAPSSPMRSPRVKPEREVPFDPEMFTTASSSSISRGRSFTAGDSQSAWEAKSDFDDSDVGDSPMIRPITSPMPTPPTSPTQMSQRDRVNRLLKNFFHTKCVDTVTEELTKKSLCSISATDFVYRGLSMSFDRRDEDREAFSSLMSKLCALGSLDKSTIHEGSLRALEDLEDLVIDVPHCPTYAGKYLAASLTNSFLEVSNVSEILNGVSQIDSNLGLEVSKQLVKTMKEALGPEPVMALLADLQSVTELLG